MAGKSQFFCLPSCPDLSVSVPAGFACLENNCQTEICYASRHVILQKHILAFEISVSDGRLSGFPRSFSGNRFV